MSFLKRTLGNAISKGLSDALGKAVQQVVEPKATEYANKAAEHFGQASDNAAPQARQAASGLEGAFANLGRSLQSYATEMGKNMKVCPQCQQPASADNKFCPSCGGRLPEQTLAEGAVCPGCGKQNNLGMKFCSDCGTKLPSAVAEEQAAAARDAAVMQEWDEKLPQYPKWCFGGTQLSIEEYSPGCYGFFAAFAGNIQAAHWAVDQYRQTLVQNGFRQAGQYPSMNHLYKRLNGVVFHVDTEHCFDGDPDRACIGFDVSEPYGGFDYVKPEPVQRVNLKDLFKL